MGLLHRLVWSAVVGAGVTLGLTSLGARQLISAVAADPACNASIGRVAAAGLWLHAAASLRWASAFRPRTWCFTAALASSFLATAVCSLLATAASSAIWGGSWTAVQVLDASTECVLFAVLSACLLEAVHEPRALVAWFVAAAWALPALLRVEFLNSDAANEGLRAPSSLLALLPLATAAAALVAAAVQLRPRLEAE